MMALAGGEPENGDFFCLPIEIVAVIQLTGIFDRRIIPRLAVRQESGCSAAW